MKKIIDINQSKSLFNKLVEEGFDFFTGVPDSTLKSFIRDIDKSSITHVLATHESQSMGIAIGAYLGHKKPCVYMQNSGLGNVVNPIASLCHPFNIFPLLIIGHRHSLPQHKIMGLIDEKLLSLLDYPNYILVYGDNNEK